MLTEITDIKLIDFDLHSALTVLCRAEFLIDYLLFERNNIVLIFS